MAASSTTLARESISGGEPGTLVVVQPRVYIANHDGDQRNVLLNTEQGEPRATSYHPRFLGLES